MAPTRILVCSFPVGAVLPFNECTLQRGSCFAGVYTTNVPDTAGPELFRLPMSLLSFLLLFSPLLPPPQPPLLPMSPPPPTVEPIGGASGAASDTRSNPSRTSDGELTSSEFVCRTSPLPPPRSPPSPPTQPASPVRTANSSVIEDGVTLDLVGSSAFMLLQLLLSLSCEPRDGLAWNGVDLNRYRLELTRTTCGLGLMPEAGAWNRLDLVDDDARGGAMLAAAAAPVGGEPESAVLVTLP